VVIIKKELPLLARIDYLVLMNIDIKKTPDGQEFVLMPDAQKVFDLIRDDPKQIFGILWEHCNERAERAIGYSIEHGIPASILGRAVLDSGYSRGAFPFSLHLDVDNSGGSFKEFCQALGVDERFPVVKRDGFVFQSYIKGHMEDRTDAWSVAIYKDGSDPESGFSVHDGNFDETWSDHVAMTIKVFDQEAGDIVTMVVDPLLSTGPISLVEWKNRQNNEDAVLAHAPVGELLTFVTDKGAMSDEFEQNLRPVINEVHPEAAAWDIATALGELSREQYDRVFAQAQRLPIPEFPGENPRNMALYNFDVFRELTGDHNLAGKLLEDQTLLTHRVSHDWDSFSADEQKDLAKKWGEHLAPLRAFQEWWQEQLGIAGLSPKPSGESFDHD
jgi:hypothetical protein